MKNYNIGDEVTISRPGIFDQAKGVILSFCEHSEKVNVILTDSRLLWCFSKGELLKGEDKGTSRLKTTNIAKSETVTETIITSDKPKRGRKPKDKTEVKVIKRKYTKKAK